MGVQKRHQNWIHERVEPVMKKFWLWNLKLTPAYHFSKGKYGKGLLLLAVNFTIGAAIAMKAQETKKNPIKSKTSKEFDEIVKYYEQKAKVQ
jgi:hypothetical protein